MTNEEFQQMNNEMNIVIMGVAYKLYNMGCWFSDMSFIPPAGLQFTISCHVSDVNNVIEDDKRRAEMAQDYFKKHFGGQLQTMYVMTKVKYEPELISKTRIMNGIKCMLEI